MPGATVSRGFPGASGLSPRWWHSDPVKSESQNLSLRLSGKTDMCGSPGQGTRTPCVSAFLSRNGSNDFTGE